MRPIELVGKDLFFFPAFRALAHKRFKLFVTLPPRAMCRCIHHSLRLRLSTTFQTPENQEGPLPPQRDNQVSAPSSSMTSLPLCLVPQLGQRISTSCSGPMYFSFMVSGATNETSPQAHWGHSPWTVCLIFLAICHPPWSVEPHCCSGLLLELLKRTDQLL